MLDSSQNRPGQFRFSSRLERRIVRKAGRAVGEFGLIAADDHLLVAVSGGKDSLALLQVLLLLRRRSPVRFELSAVTINPGVPGFSSERVATFCRQRGVSHREAPVPIAQILEEKLSPGSSPCALCSRIRRGALYTLAPQLGCNKIALGHHLDDLVETLLLNLFFSGQLRSMAPRFRSDDGRNWIIRPLCLVPEEWLQSYAEQQRLPIATCADLGCPGDDGQRRKVKNLVAGLAQDHPRIRWHILRALRNVRPEHLLDQAVRRDEGR